MINETSSAKIAEITDVDIDTGWWRAGLRLNRKPQTFTDVFRRHLKDNPSNLRKANKVQEEAVKR